MKNKLTNLNNYLFAQIERLSNEDMDLDGLSKEINRARAIQCIASAIIDNARLAFEAHKAIHIDKVKRLPEMMGVIE